MQKIFIFLMTIHLSGLFLLITKGNLSNVNVLQRYGYQVLDYPVPTPATSLLSSPTTVVTDILAMMGEF